MHSALSSSRTIVAAFDFDGTLTRRDTMLDFVRFVHGDVRYAQGMMLLAPSLLRYALGDMTNEQAKTALLTHFFAHIPAEKLYRWGEAYCQQRLPALLRRDRMALLHGHMQAGHSCYLVTASLAFWTEAFAAQQGMTLIATQPEIVQGVFTGKISGRNCFGQEKVTRLQAQLAATGIVPTEIHAYGDSDGDRELLAWASVAHDYRRKKK